MSLARTSLIKLYNAITNLKKEFWWSPKKKLDSALKKWQKEDRERYTQLIETMRTLDNMEEKY